MTRLALTHRSPLVAFALVAALASGCAVGPNYSRPQVPTPPQYRFVEGPAEAETIADVPWWSITKDPQLQALLRRRSPTTSICGWQPPGWPRPAPSTASQSPFSSPR